MQFGLPCIATSFGGIPDVLGDGRGILLKERSVGAIEQALEELCEQPELRLQISQKAFAYFHEHFTQACFEKRCRDCCIVGSRSTDSAEITKTLRNK